MITLKANRWRLSVGIGPSVNRVISSVGEGQESIDYRVKMYPSRVAAMLLYLIGFSGAQHISLGKSSSRSLPLLSNERMTEFSFLECVSSRV